MVDRVHAHYAASLQTSTADDSKTRKKQALSPPTPTRPRASDHDPYTPARSPALAQRHIACASPLAVATTPDPTPAGDSQDFVLITPDGRRRVPSFVDVSYELTHRRVAMANPDSSLVIGTRGRPGSPHEVSGGIVAMGVAAGIAVIMKSPEAIGLAHIDLTGPKQHRAINRCMRQFREQSTESPSLTFGYNPDEFRRSVFEQATLSCSALESSTHGPESEPQALTPQEENMRLARQVVFKHCRSFERLARQFRATLQPLPSGEVLVPRVGGSLKLGFGTFTLDPFETFNARTTAAAGAAWLDAKRAARQSLHKPKDEKSAARAAPALSSADGGARLAAVSRIPTSENQREAVPVWAERGTYEVRSPGDAPRQFVPNHLAPTCLHALIADRSGVLVTARRDENIDGICFDGRGKSVAVIQQSTTLVGLAHVYDLTGDALQSKIAALRDEFGQRVRDAEGLEHAPVKLMLGYCPRELRSELEGEYPSDAGHAPPLAIDKPAPPALDATPHQATDEEQREAAIDAQWQRRMDELNHVPGSDLVLLVDPALLLRPDGSIHGFFGEGPHYDER